MPNDQFWLEVAKLIVTTGATGVAAWFGIGIARSQRNISAQQKNIALEAKQIAAAKLNLDLYEERYALFLEVWTYLTLALNTTADDHPRTDFTNHIPKAQFLFGKEIGDYMRDMDSKRIELIFLYKQSNNPPVDYATRISDLSTWFEKEASGCYKRFDRYLNFANWQTEDWAKAKLPVESK